MVETPDIDADHPDVARSRSDLAGVLLERGHGEEALRLAEQAWTRLERADTPLEVQAYAS